VQSSSQNVANNKPTPIFLQAGCHSCRPTNSDRAPKGKVIKYIKNKIFIRSTAPPALAKNDRNADARSVCSS